MMQTLAALLIVLGAAGWILLIRVHVRDRKHGRIAGLFEHQPKEYRDWVEAGGRRKIKDLLWP